MRRPQSNVFCTSPRFRMNATSGPQGFFRSAVNPTETKETLANLSVSKKSKSVMKNSDPEEGQLQTSHQNINLLDKKVSTKSQHSHNSALIMKSRGILCMSFDKQADRKQITDGYSSPHEERFNTTFKSFINTK